ncbi:MAG: hypothetical protein IPQ22_17415 [Rhodoferax sp.]|nr:hypothetical protein [Rhodoferax sp.]
MNYISKVRPGMSLSSTLRNLSAILFIAGFTGLLTFCCAKPRSLVSLSPPSSVGVSGHMGVGSSERWSKCDELET